MVVFEVLYPAWWLATHVEPKHVAVFTCMIKVVYLLFIYLFIYLFILFQNPYTGIRPMDIGTVKE
jgi:RsiW-degrading membrane proteinase PrsW (M82 family)